MTLLDPSAGQSCSDIKTPSTYKEQALTINQTGIQGATGAPGAPGVAGTPGIQGASGKRRVAEAEVDRDTITSSPNRTHRGDVSARAHRAPASDQRTLNTGHRQEIWSHAVIVS